jgi:hypothetical protein
MLAIARTCQHTRTGRRAPVCSGFSKDLAQAGALIEALAERRPFELAEAWAEASARGPKWRSALARSRSLLAPEQEDALTRSLARID